jgi:hypothetical protein
MHEERIDKRTTTLETVDIIATRIMADTTPIPVPCPAG